MSKNAWKMAKENGVSYATMLRWIKKGYFGEIEKDKRGAYILPDDLPLAYHADGKTVHDSTLLKDLLDASDLGRCVHRKMFPNIEEERFNRILAYAAKEHLVEIQTPYPGVTLLSSTPEGRALINAQPKVKSKVIDRVIAGANLVITLAQFGLNYGPQIVEMIHSVA